MSLSNLLLEKWLWVIVLMMILVIIIPFIIIYFILLLPPGAGPAISTILILVFWSFASGYKDWVKAKRKEEEELERRKLANA